jgi:N-acetyl-anhydromuramyl-L-alanine amidase AmpD
MKILDTQSPNQEYGRRDYKPEIFIIHTTEGKTGGSVAWCKNPESMVSYHYIVDEIGDAWQLVKPENTAWHAGKAIRPTWINFKQGVNPNLYSIGIAFGGFADSGPTLKQFISIAELLRNLAVIHKIPLDRLHVIGHNEIRTDKVCPGAHINLDALIFLAQLK